jgi:hypothetical protein
MMFSFRSLMRRPKSWRGRRPLPSARPAVEALEDRTVPATITVKAFSVTGGTQTTSDNDYTRIDNAIQNANSGDIIKLSGTFKWTNSHAAASWALGSDGIAATDDDYSITAPADLNGVTITAVNGLGSATIQGPGATAGVDLTGVFFFGGTNQNWSLSNLRLVNFDFGIWFSSSTLGDFDGTKIASNYIKVATNLNSTQDPAYVDPNFGINYGFGQNQLIKNNTIEFPGNGISNGTATAEDIGILCNTSGSSGAYNNLQITTNTFRVLNAQSSSPESLLGLWENSYDNASTITVSGNQFLNAGSGNNSTLNDQIAFLITAHSSLTTTVKYNNNTINGAHVAFEWMPGQDFSSGGPVRLWVNTINNAAIGILVQSNGSANIYRNTIAASKTAGIEVTDGGRLETASSVTNAVQENYIWKGAAGIIIDSSAGTIGSIFDNNLAQNSGFALDNESGQTITATKNWWGTSSAPGVAAKIKQNPGTVNHTPFLTSGTDTQTSTPGFQGKLT